MATKKYSSFLTLFLIIVLCTNLANVQAVRADEGTPTEPPAPTQVATEPPIGLPTEPPVDSTPDPVETEPPVTSTMDPIEATVTPLAEIPTQAPEGTEVVVLDENGNALPLATQETADIMEATDPMWCPAGVLPGGAGCSSNFGSPSLLVGDMGSNTSFYTQNGIIYFISTAGGPLTVTSSTLTGGDFDTLKGFNLILQGGWNGNTVSPSFSGQTNFANNVITIGTAANPWVGNLTLNDFTFSSGDQPNVNIATTSGNITLSNIDVLNHQNGTNTAILNSTSGNITVQNGSTFSGNSGGNESDGFSATTASGSITISDTTFSNSRQNGNGATPNNTNDGATLSAPTVTLTNVTSTNNDGNGITINNANLVTLNNVISSNNGTESGPNGLTGNLGSGVFVNGNPGSRLIIIGGTFNNNQEYGVKMGNPANTTIYIQAAPTCTGNDSNAAGLGCYNDTTVFDDTAPVITPNISGTAGSNGWYTSNVSVSWTVTDTESGVNSSTGCTTSNLTSETSGTTLTCSAFNNAGLLNSASVTIKIDKTAPTAALTITGGTLGNNSWYTSDVTVHTSGADSLSNPVTCTADQIQSTETAGVTINGSCTNNAGLTTNASPLTIKLDKTAPTAVLSVTAGNAGTNGWYTSDVTVHTSGTESISSPVTCIADQFQTSETNGTTFKGSCTNNAGLGADASPLTIKLDKTNPIISFVSRTPPNGNGWNNTDVTVDWTCSDGFSGPVADTVNQTVATEGSGQSASGTCTDNAGNTASDTRGGINIDKTAPALTLPSDIITQATSASGAVVSYSASVTDNLDATVVVNCAPASGSTFGFGATTVNCSSTDLADNTASGSFHVTVQDTTAPVIAAHADETVEATSASGAIANYTSPSTSDAVDGAGTAVCSPVSGTAFPLGDTTITCNATDVQGNAAAPTTFVIHVVDTTAPVIAAHLDVTVEATSAAGAVATYTNPSTLDIVDGSGTASCAPASGMLFPLGDTTVSCNATDAHGNAATPTTFVVHVVDTTAPVIAAHADMTAEATSSSGAVVSYTSPSTSDIVDGAGTANCSPASGITFALGNTTVTCNAMDTHGNLAASTSFTVHVLDTTAPILNLPGNITANATGPAGAVVTYSASASDLVDGSVAVSCDHASGSTFPLGPTTVSCSATDAHANNGTGSFTVNIQDPDAPTLNLPGNMTVEATGPGGATVSYSASATDVVDGSVPVSCTPNSGSSFGFGTTVVNCSATDSSNNTNSAAFVVTVQDTTAPSIAPHSDFTTTTSNPSGVIVTYTSPATSDAVDGAGTASCLPTSGSLFPIGDTQVACSATDSHGNTATYAFFIHVVLANQSSGSNSVPSVSSSSNFTIPVTGGKLIPLDCNTVLWAFGIKLSFLNLCDQQTTLHRVGANDLPAELPAGFSFVMGLDVDILTNGQLIKDLPDGSGVEMDFPLYDQSQDKFAVLYWSDKGGDGKGEWIEVSKSLNPSEISTALSQGNDLYHLVDQGLVNLFYQTLTTDKTGIFVLVKK